MRIKKKTGKTSKMALKHAQYEARLALVCLLTTPYGRKILKTLTLHGLHSGGESLLTHCPASVRCLPDLTTSAV